MVWNYSRGAASMSPRRRLSRKLKAIDYALIIAIVSLVLAVVSLKMTGFVVNPQAPIIIPAIATINSNLNCSALYYDPGAGNGTTVNITFSWYKNGVLNDTYNGTAVNVPNNSTAYTNVTVPNSVLSAGDNWTCIVQAFDGASYSNETNASVIIQGFLLVVWDETNATMPYAGLTKYYGDTVKIFANLTYTNGNFDFNDNCSASINGSAFAQMSYNNATGLLAYTSGPHNLFGSVPYNVSCTTGQSRSSTFLITNPIPAGCNTTIIHSVRLNQSYNEISGGTCFTIGASGIMLDCNDYNITGTGNGTAVFSSSTGASVLNCNISNFFEGVVIPSAANNANVNGNVINNVTSDGIRLSANNNYAYYNTISAPGAVTIGIVVQGNNNYLRYNNISSSQVGVLLDTSTSSNTIEYSNITGTTISAFVNGSINSYIRYNNFVNASQTAVQMLSVTSGVVDSNTVSNSTTGLLLQQVSGLSSTGNIFGGIAGYDVNSSTGSNSNIFYDTNFGNIFLASDTTNMDLGNCSYAVANVAGGQLRKNYYLDITVKDQPTNSSVGSVTISAYNSTGSFVKSANTDGAGFARQYLLYSTINSTGQSYQNNYTIAFSKFVYFLKNISINMSGNQAFIQYLNYSASYFNFLSSGTDFNNAPNLSSVTNATLVTSNGKIAWTNPINAINQNFDANVFINANNITVNATGLDPSINSSATLTLSGLAFQNPRLMKNGAPCSDCIRVNYSGGSLVFNVTRFSSYSSEENFINLTYPLNNTVVGVSAFSFNFVLYSNYYSNQSCSLYINGTLNQTKNAVNGLMTSFNMVDVRNGAYSWMVSCNATGNSATYYFNVTSSAAPSISSVSSSVTSSTATINWTTDKNSTTVVYYGNATNNLVNTISSSSLVTAHSILVNSLLGNKTYYYNVSSCEINNICSTSGTYSFSTLAKSNGISCTLASECSGGYCVHGICRSGSTYCGDGYCDTSLGESTSNCPADCSSGSSGPSGGTPETPVTVSQYTETQSFPTIPANTLTTLAFTLPDNPLQEISLISDSIVANPSVAVTFTTAQPSGVLAPPVGEVVYKYLIVNESANLQNVSLSDISLKVRVEKSWYSANGLDPNTTTVRRYENSTSVWRGLDTTLFSENATHYIYRAVSPGLSFFAIDAAALLICQPPCNQPTNWSTCTGGIQSRTIYACSEQTLTCVPRPELRNCEVPINATNVTGSCGNKICEIGETFETCPFDCGAQTNITNVTGEEFDISQYSTIIIALAGIVMIVAVVSIIYYTSGRKK